MMRSALQRLLRSSLKNQYFLNHTCGSNSKGLTQNLPLQSIRSLSSGWISQTSPLFRANPGTENAIVSEYQHATGLEKEEIEAQLEGTSRFETAPPRGPFGTKEAPAIVESQFDERIVGCSGGIAEEEHDVVWFKLKKGETHDCIVCGQVFQLKVVGEGGIPGAHH